MNVIFWLIIGAVAGWIAGNLMRGGGFGLVGNIVVGIVGALVGGWVFGLHGHCRRRHAGLAGDGGGRCLCAAVHREPRQASLNRPLQQPLPQPLQQRQARSVVRQLAEPPLQVEHQPAVRVVPVGRQGRGLGRQA